MCPLPSLPPLLIPAQIKTSKDLNDFRAPLEELLVVLRNCQKESAADVGTTPTLSMEIPEAFAVFDRFQVEEFLMLMEEQIQSKQSLGPQVWEEFTFKDMLSFQKDPIPTSLLKIDSDLISRATKLFQIVLKYMGVYSSNGDERIELFREIHKQTFKRSELVDEVLVQLSKQTRKNPDRQYLVKAWELMYLCASSMSPSIDIGGYLLDYIHTVANGVNVDSEVRTLATNSLNALKRVVKAGPRYTIPEREETEALLSGRKLTTTVFFLDGAFEEIPYDMATTVAESVQELAGIIKLSAYESFGLFECREVAAGSKSSDTGNEYIGLDDNKYVGDLLVKFKAPNGSRKGLHCKLMFKRKLFREPDEAATDPMFIQLSYVQLQHDYILGNYPVRDEAAQLSALQILVEIGFVDTPESSMDWNSLLERFLPRQIAITRAKREWELDILSRYRLMERLTKDDARQQFLLILRELPYGNSVFISVKKIGDPIGNLPGRIILGVSKKGVHFFRTDPKEYLHSVKLPFIKEYGCTETELSLGMKVERVYHLFTFETTKGYVICDALKIYIDDALKIYIDDMCPLHKARSAASGSVSDSQRNANQLLEELHEMQKREVKMQEEIEELKESLSSVKQNLAKVMSDCDEKDKALQDIDRKNEQTAAILKMQGAQLAELQVLYKEEQILRKRKGNDEDLGRNSRRTTKK